MYDGEVAVDDELGSPSLVELAVSRLRHEILGGAFVPGDRIVEEQVTRRFGISRAPVREALRLLAEQGLVQHLPRRGVRVATLSDRDARELFELRDVLERYAVQRMRAPTDERLSGMRGELAAMTRATSSGDQLALADAHRRFHTELVAMADQSQLVLAYRPILLRLQLHMAANLRREAEVATPLDGVRRHTALLDAVRSGDVRIVLTALGDHGAQAYLR